MKLVEKLDRLRNDSFPGTWLHEAMQACPDLISAERESAAIGDVADIVVGKLEDISVPIR
jgi:hypothetical protein